MKSVVLSFVVVALTSLAAMAQTPIDGLQKQNLAYLETLESEGYEFRSQIITEFDLSNSSQNVNINLSKDYSYVVVALGDSDIPNLTITIRSPKGASVAENKLSADLNGQSFQVTPTKSGRFKFTIGVSGLSASDKGFVSFMVLRK